MSKTHRIVQNSFKTASVSPAKALSAAKRVRDDREATPAATPAATLSALYKSAPVLVKKAA